jgi:hypothetical protein
MIPEITPLASLYVFDCGLLSFGIGTDSYLLLLYLNTSIFQSFVMSCYLVSIDFCV